jgi:SnoaL-like domain
MNQLISSEQLAARAHIADLVHRYARNIRDGETAACASLFTVDASFETRELIPGRKDSLKVRARLVGREAIVDYLNRPEVRLSVCPSVSNLLIDVRGDQAGSNCLMQARVWASGQTLFGEYDDTYRCDGQWRFSSRIYTIFRARPVEYGET